MKTQILNFLGIKTKEQKNWEHIRNEGMRMRCEKAFGLNNEYCKCDICKEWRLKQ